MIIKDHMKRSVISIKGTATIKEAAQLVMEHNVGTLPVVDEENNLIGVLNLADLLSIIMPDFIDLVESFKFVHNFGAVEARIPAPEVLACPVSELMKEAVYAKENAGLLYAAAQLHQYRCTDLPIVTEEGKLIGLISHVDIGAALMRGWKKVKLNNNPDSKE